jgi:hypothetical protein
MQPVIDAIRALQAAAAQNAGGQQHRAESRDSSRFGLQVMGGIIGLVLFVVAILQAISISQP